MSTQSTGAIGSSLGDEGSSSPALPQTPALLVSHVSKEFGGTRALDDVSMAVSAGEVHGLLGENGSGKSTLIKMLAGVHEPDRGGAMEVFGALLRWPIDQTQLRGLGVQIVHQELGLVDSLSVAENFAIFRQGELGRFRIGWRSLNRQVAAELESHGVDVDPTVPVDRLSPVTRAEVAVVRAVGSFVEGLDPCRILVLDEPTVFLSQEAVLRLFGLVRTLRSHGKAVLFVSHDIDEVLEITDSVTVLRDGRVQGTRSTAGLTANNLVELILGRRLSSDMARAELSDVVGGRMHLTEGLDDLAGHSFGVEGLSGGRVKNLSFQVAPGEVVAVTGLVGSGFEEVPYLLIGSELAQSGVIRVGTEKIQAREISPARARELGIGHVPANRLRDAAVADLTVEENISLPVLSDAFRGGMIRHSWLQRHSEDLIARYKVRPPDPEKLFGTLSGGNQQKVVLGKCLQESPRVIILHEPTQGIDVGSREQMAQEIERAASEGVSVILASADYGFIADTSQRVLIMSNGKLVNQLSGGMVTKRNIAERCLTSRH
jgi:ribose transport system ATP-binding protein